MDYQKQGIIRKEKLPQWFIDGKDGKEEQGLIADDEEFQCKKAELEAKIRKETKC
ncbi:hypothetical protein [Jeotgalibacillus soli]|uniref:Uncharacterized protein n=1 Tax=Jeotgalibacillus soli TaxID=889306 RepID=A0A0C2RK95_9BACL|nr:hypothetical protein [Jeotgalibacillus soli]KIL50605.1 hypothetical protein KP78_06060 [Jeotgalibacillus soli]